MTQDLRSVCGSPDSVGTKGVAALLSSLCLRHGSNERLLFFFTSRVTFLPDRYCEFPCQGDGFIYVNLCFYLIFPRVLLILIE